MTGMFWYSLGYDGYAERLGHGADVLVTVGVARSFLRVAPVDRQRRDAARLDHPRKLYRLLNLTKKQVEFITFRTLQL